MPETIEEFLLARLEEIKPLLEDFGYTMDQNFGAMALYHSQLAIIEWHKNWPVLVETKPEYKMEPNPLSTDSYIMSMAQNMAWLTQEEFRKRFGSEPPTAPLLKKMAQNYSWHSDFQEEWED